MTSRHEKGTPEVAAGGGAIGALVYFSSVSENTARFVADCRLHELGINVHRLPLRPNDEPLAVREPYVLMTPTYGGGSIAKAVPVQVKRFLNDPANRRFIRGVIASGNTNFGEAYGVAGDVIAAKCHVPFLYRFELMGTPEDRERVRDGLVAFFRRLDESAAPDGDGECPESPNPTPTNESE
ncbi:class Ib ribonucleoside-diphosphate reductase assembly flavoprotein NrdI [Bifidobacterium primatium]|uniref:Protein NrdI n=1 Tax=Bifidobacterium primatium TaxID=2045438 RepID=A0A2M9H994_9BIFI|nr:class Ib ribonucleoside-diphosphate reductase assembly flavoprotein NrdI [Bifidobacterium primatium]PJM73392.1 class Ib ribonucleoside-diphosphate reductase assembly flavoprotein NrdI [Bifidobacterium primatium]